MNIAGVAAALRQLADALEAAPPEQGDGLPPRDLTIAEVAERVRRSRSTVRAWCSSGRLTSYKLRRRDHRVTIAALEEFLVHERNGHGAT